MGLLQRTISSLLLCVVILLPSVIAVDVDEDQISHKLESSFQDGTFINGTLNVTGTITSDSTDVYWTLFDFGNTQEIIISGNFFTEVIPLSVDRWQWFLEIDVSSFDCACVLSLVHHIDSQDSLYLDKSIFIGEGPFSPILRIIDTELVETINFELKLSAVVANGLLNESTIFVSFCKLTSGSACDESTNHTRQLPTTWSGNEAILVLNFSDLSLTEGKWSFGISLRDSNLLQSGFTYVLSRKVDFNPPVARLVAAESVNESATIILDGSSSDDGIWTSDLQVVWYITEPNGTIRNPSHSENNGLSLVLQPTVIGNWSVHLDIIDIRGRVSSNVTTFEVLNVAPEAHISLDELNLNEHRYRMPHWADWSLDAIESHDLVEDDKFLVHRWYVDGELVSNISKLDLAALGLQPGNYEIVLEVIDTGGAIGTSSMVLEVYSDERDSESNPLLGWLSIGLLVVIVIIFSIGYIVSRDKGSPSVPSWQDNRKSESVTGESSTEAMWDENA